MEDASPPTSRLDVSLGQTSCEKIYVVFSTIVLLARLITGFRRHCILEDGRIIVGLGHKHTAVDKPPEDVDGLRQSKGQTDLGRWISDYLRSAYRLCLASDGVSLPRKTRSRVAIDWPVKPS
jgi:hypothetical protein